ncbi:MAG: crossover junction endodeoxyribonuclease RuvC [Clostridiales Family XIII bacterium]|nr:crossover junction endodeoxyribonuclease RuvC [Clostridiales Family XIII bacterium]
MKILGIDPGYAILGYGAINMEGSKFSLCGYGTITTASGVNMPDRLKCLYTELMDVIQEYEPDVASLEELFFNSNAKTAIMVGQARGAVILACVNSGLEICEYTPLQIKQGLTGYGRAEKTQMQAMVKNILRLKEIPRPDDAADALAAAICHGHSSGYRRRFQEKLHGSAHVR